MESHIQHTRYGIYTASATSAHPANIYTTCIGGVGRGPPVDASNSFDGVHADNWTVCMDLRGYRLVVCHEMDMVVVVVLMLPLLCRAGVDDV